MLMTPWQFAYIGGQVYNVSPIEIYSTLVVMNKALFINVILGLVLIRAQVPLRPLEHLNVEPHITISGFSFGGGFASILSWSFSSFIKGTGIFTGFPMGIGVILWRNPLNTVTFRSYPEVIEELAREQLIDDPSHLKNDNAVYIYHGGFDVLNPKLFSNIIVRLYARYGVPRITTDIGNVPSGHCIPINVTNSFKFNCFKGWGELCGCGFHGVARMFSHFLPHSFKHPLPSHPTGTTLRFDQSEFFENKDAYGAGFLDFGYIYIPKRCEPQTGVICKLHFTFHGCSQNMIATLLGSVPTMVTKAGFREVADANDVVVVFPQSWVNIWNASLGCFDVIGHTSGKQKTFSTKFGVHPSVIKRMYNRIAHGL